MIRRTINPAVLAVATGTVLLGLALAAVSEAATILVKPGRLDRFVVNAPRGVTAGETFQARVIAQDAFGNTKDDLADVRESLRLGVQGTGSAAAADKTTPPFRGGEATFTFLPRKAGSIRVVVQETRTRSAGESAGIKVNAAALDHFTVIGPKSAVAGEKFVVLRPSGTGVLAPSAVAAKEFHEGQAKATLTYTKAEALRVGVREQNREAAGESDAILVAPGDADQFRVNTPAEAVAGEQFPVPIVSSEDAARERVSALKAREEAVKAAEKAPAKPAVKVLERVNVEEGKDRVLVRLSTSGPVSYNASTGSRLSREWIWLELLPVRADAAVGTRVAVASSLVGEVTIEQVEPEKVRVSLQVLPPGISYVVTQQDRSVVVKVVRTE